MNSHSKFYHDDDCDCDPCGKDKKDFCKKDKKDMCPVIIKCSAPGAVTIPGGSEVGDTFTATSLTLNTGCICNPIVKLEFTSNLVATVAFTGTISFQVFKQCLNQFTPVPVGPSFSFARDALISSDTFTFFICDCDSCFHDCCTYTVVATVTAATTGNLAINNATLGAIATCATSGCC